MYLKNLLVAFLLVVFTAANEASDVKILTDQNFDTLTANGEWLLEFYAPWCGHCKKLAPIYDELASKVKDNFNIAKIDCTVEKGLATRFAIKGYPTIKFLKEGMLFDYNNARTVDAFEAYLDGGYSTSPSNSLPAATAPQAEPAKTTTTAGSDVVTLTDASFDQLTSQGIWFLEFYAPWCGHCKRLAPVYEEVATLLKGQVNFGKIDCTTERAACSQYDVNGYPTIYFVKNNEMRSYEGPRSVDGFKKFFEGNWKDVTPTPVPEPISGWKSMLYNAINQIESVLSMDIWVIVGICIALGVILGLVVVAMTPSPTPKTIHYPPSSTPAPSTPQDIDLTEEITSKDD